jgi:hypothetical protein
MTLSQKSKKRSRIKKARDREENAASQIGGQRCSGSGSGIVKGDARNSKWTLEDKHTESKQFLITEDIVNKIISQSHKTGRNPVIRIGTRGLNLALILWDDFLELIESEDE